MTERIKVVCLECGKKFQTVNLIPECPKCGGVDVDVREDIGAWLATKALKTLA